MGAGVIPALTPLTVPRFFFVLFSFSFFLSSHASQKREMG